MKILTQSTPLVGVKHCSERPGTKCPGLYQGQFKTRRDSSKLFYCYSHLEFKDPKQPSTLPKARPRGSPTCPGRRQGGWGKRRGPERARSDSFAPPPWPLSAIWDHPQDSSRTVTATVPFDPGSCTAGLRPHTLPGPRLGGQTARGTFGQENYILPACFPVIHWLPPGWTAGRKGPGCGPTSHSQLGNLFQDCVLNRLWN